MSATNESIIYGYLIGQEHLSKAGAAGVLGNFEVESGFSPTSVNAREGAIGLPNWEGGRRTALQRYAAAHGGKETDLTMQLGYLGQELGGSYSRVLGFLRKTNDPAAAAAYFDVGPGGPNSGTGFENSSGDATGLRQANAQTIYQQIQAGQLSASKAPAGTPGPPSSKPAPPFSSLKKPLSASQRQAAIAWLVQIGGSASQMAKLSDSALIGTYNLNVRLYKIGKDPAGSQASGGLFPSIDDLFDFSWVVQLVVKSAFTTGGLALVVLGLYAAAQPVRDKAGEAAAAAAPIAEAAA